MSGVYNTDKSQSHQVVCVQSVACKCLYKFDISWSRFKNGSHRVPYPYKYISDSNVVINKIYKRTNETDHVLVKPVERSEVCTLKNAIDVNLDGKLFCLAHIGKTKHKDALNLCQKMNSTLPLPRNLKENYHYVDSFKRLGFDRKLEDFSTKIVLDVRRLPNKG